MSEERPQFLLFDGHAILYRAYHAYPNLTSPAGKVVGALYGFTRIVLTTIRNYEPEYVAIAFDHPKPTFRHDKFEAYKAQRDEMPDDLKEQVDEVKKIVKAINIPQFEMSGYEADDLIGTLTLQAEKNEEDLETVVVTGDKDLLQLVTDQTRVYIPGRGKMARDAEYDPAMVKEKMGVEPLQVIDLKAFMGDASDNIPGVRGIGKGTATKLVAAYGEVDKIYELVKKIKSGEAKMESPITASVLKKLDEGFEAAQMSRELVTINRQAPIKLDLKKCQIRDYNKSEVADAFEELGFHSLVKLLPEDSFEMDLQAALF